MTLPKRGMPKFLLISIFSFVAVTGLRAQGVNVRGKAIDAADNSSIVSAAVSMYKTSDTLHKQYTQTDTAGKFQFAGVVKDNYIVKISFFGYKPLYVKVAVDQKDINLGRLKLNLISMKEVKVVGHQVRAEQLGDTVQYHADAFKTNPDATAEDLITKMPGIVVQNGSVQAHGEDVKQVLVDGKPYFGDDPTTALRNLPAEVIDKVQVYDKMSDQSQFTGFDDGNSQKTINIITKKNRQNGIFGRGVIGGGTDNTQLTDPKYQASETFNIFDNNRRISIIGLSNNINQQNFATSDLLGVMGSSSQRSFGGGGRGGPSIQRAGNGGSGIPGSSISNFIVGQQGGINTTNSAGLNYSDSIGKRLYLTGSYFFNNTNNNTQSTLARTYFAEKGLSPLYNENDLASSKNYNHRANLRMEYRIDSANSLVFTPKFNYQNTNIESSVFGYSRTSTFDTTNKTNNNYGLTSTGYDFNADLLWRHKFKKVGRTLSWDIGTDISPKTASDSLNGKLRYYTPVDSNATVNQRSTTPSKSMNFSTSLSYTEPVGKIGQIQINYNPSYTQSTYNKTTVVQNLPNGEYIVVDSALSNAYSYTNLTQKGGLSYRMRIKTINISAGVNFQSTQLNGAQTMPVAFSADKLFYNFLPTVMFSDRFTNKSNLRVIYSTSAGIPSISQLQSVVNNTNPLLLTIGNPNLVQTYTHNLVIRYGKTNTTKAHSFFLFGNVSTASNYIGNSTIIASKDSILPGGFKLAKGSQLTSQVNLNNYWNARAFATFGLPLDFMKSNLNLNGGVTFNSTPGLINNVLNYANTYALNPGLVMSSNISEKVDFTLSYNSSYNIVKNTLNAQGNNNYFTHTAGFKFNWIFWKGFNFVADISHTLYTGLTSQYNQSLLIVNGGIGKKLFKDQGGEVRLSVFDALNNNTSITRTVTDTYIDDVQTLVLKRYIMLTFSYNLKKFKS